MGSGSAAAALVVLCAIGAPSAAALSQSCAPHRGPVRRIAVVGGTHGNEFTGVYVVGGLGSVGGLVAAGLRVPEGLNVDAHVAHPEAVRANKRFLDEDLNRRFSRELLLDAANAENPTIEAKRSLELNGLFGPKGSPGAADVVVDLHTTTANMGTTLIVDSWDGWALHCAAYVAQQLRKDEDGLGEFFSDAKILVNALVDQEASPYLASVGKHAVVIEVGPTPQGLLRHDVVLATRATVQHVVDFAALYNARLSSGRLASPSKTTRGKMPRAGDVVDVYADGARGKLAWPVDLDGFPAALVHRDLQDRDWQPLKRGDALWASANGETIAYDGEETVYPIFINEAGYYYASSGVGIGVAVKTTITLPPLFGDADDAPLFDEDVISADDATNEPSAAGL